MRLRERRKLHHCKQLYCESTMFNCFPDTDAQAHAWVGPGLATPLMCTLSWEMCVIHYCVAMWEIGEAVHNVIHYCVAMCTLSWEIGEAVV